MGMGVPLLNEYKQSFLLKRIPQTVLGGLKLKLGYDAPFYVYVNQIVLWLVPLLLGCIFTVVLELAYSDSEISDFLLLYTCLYGACIIIFVVVVQTISTVVEMKEKENQEHAAATGRGGLALMQKKFNNLLADEDEVEFESCCGAETLAFVVPPKKFKINIAFHALLSGAVCGVGFWYLLPYTLNRLYVHNYTATACVFILGWLTVCIAQYPLTTMAPPEPAVYRTMDVHEILPLTRPLYVLLCYAVHIANWYHSDFKLADQVLHGIFAALPLLWTVGLPPPAQVFILWLLEQCHVWLFGGSPAASTPRLVINLLLSAGVCAGCHFLSSTFASVLLAAGAGYLLSCDLGSLGSQIWSMCHKSNNRVSTKKVSAITMALSSPHPYNSGFLWRWNLSTVLYHVVVLVLAVGVAGAAVHRADTLSGVWRVVGYAVMGLCVAEKLLRSAQSVCGGFGLWRNCVYPRSVEDAGDFRRQKGRLSVLGYIRRLLVTWVCPLVISLYVCLLVGAEVDVMDVSLTSGKSDFKAICYVLGVVRALRWNWQSTTHALLEVSAIHIVLVTKPPGWDNIDTPVLLIIAAFARDRLCQIGNKLFFWLAVLVSSWSDKKQRRGSTAPTIVLNLVFFPIVLAVVVAASVLSAPLLCVFTLPVFFIGFPRPSKFWSEAVGGSASSCPDTLFYRQMSVELATALRSAFANGSLGEPQVGTHYLARFQDRMVWVMVLERGAAYATVSIKGLELQETSCHTAEAARIDDQFMEAFTVSASHSSCGLNQYPLHCLTPLDAVQVKTYSDAKNVLTGVIDVPGAVETTLTFFTKTLVWLLLHHINKRKKREEEARRRKEKEIAEIEAGSSSGEWVDSSISGRRKHLPPSDPGKGGGRHKVNPNKAGVVSLNLGPFRGKSTSGVVVCPPPPPFDESQAVYQHSVLTTLPPINPDNRTNLVQTHQPPVMQRPGSGNSNSSDNSRSYSPAAASLQSYTDIFSDEEDGGGDRPGKKLRMNLARSKQRHEMSTVVTITHKDPNPLPPSPTSALTSLPPLVKPAPAAATLNNSDDSNGIDDLFSETDFGLPAVDVNKPYARPNPRSVEGGPPVVGLPPGPDGLPLGLAGLPPAKPSTIRNSNHIFKPVMNLAGSPDFKCQYSSHVSIPHKWRELPIEPSQLSRYISQFPASWYQHVLGTLDWSGVSDGHAGKSIVSDVAHDDTLTNCYSQLVMACFLAFDSAGYHSGPNYLYKCYNGDVPWNAMMDWLSEDKELHSIVIKAFRFSFKLMLDQTLLGDISDGEELEECLTSLNTEWYIGREKDAEWSAAIQESRGNLFSLGYNQAQGVYTSRTLSLQPLSVFVGRVNREAVSGQWANLNLELLYMTNDDEERYSIQAQPALLRNLTVQAADPPLGYPIYSSPPISIPTL